MGVTSGLRSSPASSCFSPVFALCDGSSNVRILFEADSGLLGVGSSHAHGQISLTSISDMLTTINEVSCVE